MPKHPDFVKIYRQFMKRYCGSPDDECEKGKNVYYGWLTKLGLDDTKPYEHKEALRTSEKFGWMAPHFQFIKQDKEAKYYKVEALFPLVSMNRNLYTEDELIRGARTLKGKTVNINHTRMKLTDVSIRRAEYEDECVEVLLRVALKAKYLGQRIVDLIDNDEIVHVSIEAGCEATPLVFDPDGDYTWGCIGLEFTGLALLTKDVLPGVPLTRIMPVERVVEQAVTVIEGMSKMSEKKKLGTEADDAEPITPGSHYCDTHPEDPRCVAHKRVMHGETASAGTCEHEVDLANQRLELSEKKRRIRSLEEKLKAATGKLAAVEQEVQNKGNQEAKVAELEAACEAGKSREADLKGKVDSLESKLADAKSKGGSLTEEIAALKLEVSDWKRKNRDLTDKGKAAAAEIKAKAEEIAAKQDRINEVEHELQTEGTKVSNTEARLSELREVHKQTSDELAEKTGELVKAEKKIETANESLERVSKSISEMETKLEECSTRRFHLAERNGNLTQTLTARNEEVIKLKDRIERLEADVAKARRLSKKISSIQVRV